MRVEPWSQLDPWLFFFPISHRKPLLAKSSMRLSSISLCASGVLSSFGYQTRFSVKHINYTTNTSLHHRIGFQHCAELFYLAMIMALLVLIKGFIIGSIILYDLLCLFFFWSMRGSWIQKKKRRSTSPYRRYIYSLTMYSFVILLGVVGRTGFWVRETISVIESHSTSSRLYLELKVKFIFWWSRIPSPLF